MDEQVYIKLTATVDTKNLDTAAAIVSMVDPMLMITDYSDAETLSGVYGNLIDETILKADKSHADVSVFLSADKSVPEYRAFLSERFAAAGIPVSFSCESTREEDWAETWKQYYHPMSFGRVTIVPAWEKYEKKPDEITVLMDPGMAFGTGTHETTRLALRYLTQEIRGGEHVLDVGTGSGILSITASKLGAAHCVATDLDPDAVKNARENIAKNECQNIDCYVSDLLRAVPQEEKFDFVAANIVADILLLLIPEVSPYMRPGAKIALSGIIDGREQDILGALNKHGFRILDASRENDWNGIFAEKPAE